MFRHNYNKLLKLSIIIIYYKIFENKFEILGGVSASSGDAHA